MEIHIYKATFRRRGAKNTWTFSWHRSKYGGCAAGNGDTFLLVLIDPFIYRLFLLMY